MRHNLNALIKKELVSQFENVVREEIRQHNIAIANTDRDISFLKEQISTYLDEIRSIKKDSIDRCQNIEKRFLEERKELEKRFDEQRRHIRENIRDVSNFISKTKEDISRSLKCNQFVEYTKQIEKSLKALKTNSNNGVETLKEIIHDNSIKSKTMNEESQAEQKKELEEMMKTVNGLDKSVKEHAIDAKGVLRDLQIYKKSMFIIEKKIENIYTLIERIK